MDNAYIKGTGSYAPENVVKNDFFESVGSNDAWIQRNLGIKERRISTGETTSDLAAMAGKEAIKNAGLTPQDIDLIILATATPDKLAPSCACFVQEKIEAFNAVAFDISAVCSGALFATTTAVQFIKSGMYKNVLVIGADTFSNITDWNRRDAVFFGDGAGAMHTDGRGKDSWNIPAGGSLLPTSEETLKKGLQYFQMDGPAVFQTAIKVVPESIKKLLSKNKVSIDEVNYLIPHQPSVRILEEVANRISLPWEKVMTNMDRYANTSGGTIPMMLDETVKKNLLKKGDLVLFAAVGAGWTWGTALYKW
jgi:3-oxoacyl-[acyl-carrier-protein] synthase-3